MAGEAHVSELYRVGGLSCKNHQFFQSWTLYQILVECRGCSKKPIMVHFDVFKVGSSLEAWMEGNFNVDDGCRLVGILGLAGVFFFFFWIRTKKKIY